MFTMGIRTFHPYLMPVKSYTTRNSALFLLCAANVLHENRCPTLPGKRISPSFVAAAGPAAPLLQGVALVGKPVSITWASHGESA